MDRSTLVAIGVLAVLSVGVGVLWFVPDLVSQMRQLGTYAEADPECELSEEACTAVFADGQRVTLSLEPKGAPTETPLTLRVQVEPDQPLPSKVELQGTVMNMGLLTVPLQQTGPGQAEGRVVVPVCTTSEMDWHADVVFEDRSAGFGLQVEATDEPAVEATYGDFTVQTADGPLSLSDYQGEVVIVYFGYTSCPDICPTTLQTVAKAMHALEPEEAARVRGLMVSLDPERDGVDHLKTYTGFFHERIAGGTDSDEAIAEIAQRWGVAWQRVEDPESALGYTLDHDTRAFLVAPDGHMVGFVRHGTSADALARQIRTLL